MKKDKLTICIGEKKDLPKILHVYECARNYMIRNGNTNQWANHFPPQSLLLNDIENNRLYIIKEGANIRGVFVFIIGRDVTYTNIEQGAWISNTEYGTIHRLASDGIVSGIFNAAISFCESQIAHLRIDTHEDNKIMQHLIVKNGFQKCGIIYVADQTPRIAYEKV